jgi:hypothetical protein
MCNLKYTLILNMLFKSFLFSIKKMSTILKKIGRPQKTDLEKQETKNKSRIKQLQTNKDLSAKYKDMGLDLKKGRYSKEHNLSERKRFYEKYGIMP